MGSLGHYSELARQLPPTTLMRALARRAQRLARRSAWKKSTPTTLQEVLASHGVEHAEALATAAFDAREGRAWCDLHQRDSVVAAIATIPGARERARARAEAAVRGDYDVFGTKVSFGAGSPIEWSLDPASGFHYPLDPVEVLQLAVAGVDPKAPWVIGRMDELVALAQGAWLAGEEADRRRYVTAVVERVEDFLRNNPVGHGIQWACPMEVALRGANLAQALTMLGDRPEIREPTFLGQALTALADHAAFVSAHLEDGSAVPNNHLLANLTGLWIIHLLFPLLPQASEHLTRTRAALKEEAALQVHPEGTSFEGSVPYHRLTLEMLTLCHLAAEGHGISLGEAFAERLRGMYRVVRRLSSERGLAPQLGDNDSGRVFPWSVRPCLDFSYLTSLGAALFRDPTLKHEGDHFSDEAAWLLGSEGASRFEALESTPDAGSCSFPQAGWHVLRGEGMHLVVSAGRLGQRGIGGHSHNDALSFELHVDGVPLIVDPGSVTYTREPALRNAMRSTAAHNTLQIDGAEINPVDPQRLFALLDRSHARVEVFQRGEGVDRLVVAHDGYRRLKGGGVVERTFHLDKRERAVSVMDAFDGAGLHTLTMRLHLGSDEAELVPVPDEVLARLRRVPDAPRALASQAVRFGPAVLVLEAGLTPILEEGSVSEGYGLLRRTRVVKWRTEVSGAVRQRWAIAIC